VKLILDAGALLAIARDEQAMAKRLRRAEHRGLRIVTHGGIIGQVWRGGGPRQARLARVLTCVEVRPLDDRAGRRAGALLAATHGHDVIDAALVLLAEDDGQIFTTDAGDLAPLAEAAGLHVDLIPV
jgi:hypothetical protein